MNDRDNQNLDEAASERLRAALLRLNSRRVAVSPQVDEAILRTAREHLEATDIQTQGQPSDAVLAVPPSGDPREMRPRGTRNWLEELRAGVLEFLGARSWAQLGAVALAMIAVGALVWLGGHPRLAARPGDLNGDGVVDMLDAFALARELQQNPASHPQLDLNGDGVVDARDVQALAARAVSLETGGRS